MTEKEDRGYPLFSARVVRFCAKRRFATRVYGGSAARAQPDTVETVSRGDNRW